MPSVSSFLVRSVLVATVMCSTTTLFAEDPPCHWWRPGRCAAASQEMTEGLPADAPRTGVLVTVDVTTNRIYLFRDGNLVDQSPAATGSEKVLRKGGKTFLFHTPRGRMKVLRKIEDPVWTKPDWAFLEEGQRVPPPDSPKRRVKGHLGKYALDLGDGIMIHGTDDVGSFGKRASHGCIRVPGDMLEAVYQASSVGTAVYIFESARTQTAANNPRTGERHSDLDF